MAYQTEDMQSICGSEFGDIEIQPNMVVLRSGSKRYASDVVGQYIVDAITGAKYPWKVGSKDENRFFKVKDVGNTVSWMSKEYGCRVAHKLYYETPSEYMRHCQVNLDKKIIDSWYSKLNKQFPGEYTNIFPAVDQQIHS